MNPSKEQWASIKTELSYPYGAVYLNCDGYLVAARVKTNNMKLEIVVYVDGLMTGKMLWTGYESQIQAMPELCKRFCYWGKIKPKAKHIHLLEKLHGKRECKKRGYYQSYITAMPRFKHPASFIAHIKKHNESIQVLQYPDYVSELAKKKNLTEIDE